MIWIITAPMLDSIFLHWNCLNFGWSLWLWSYECIFIYMVLTQTGIMVFWYYMILKMMHATRAHLRRARAWCKKLWIFDETNVYWLFQKTPNMFDDLLWRHPICFDNLICNSGREATVPFVMWVSYRLCTDCMVCHVGSSGTFMTDCSYYRYLAGQLYLGRDFLDRHCSIWLLMMNSFLCLVTLYMET